MPDRYLLSATDFATYTGWYDFLKLYFEEYGPGTPGDVNIDGSVNVLDLVLIVRALGTDPSYQHGNGWGQWNPDADINQDGYVDVFDLAIATLDYRSKSKTP